MGSSIKVVLAKSFCTPPLSNIVRLEDTHPPTPAQRRADRIARNCDIFCDPRHRCLWCPKRKIFAQNFHRWLKSSEIGRHPPRPRSSTFAWPPPSIGPDVFYRWPLTFVRSHLKIYKSPYFLYVMIKLLVLNHGTGSADTHQKFRMPNLKPKLTEYFDHIIILQKVLLILFLINY